MPCAKMVARLRKDPAAGGGGVDPIAAILQRRTSNPNAGEELGFEAKEAGSMVAMQRQEGERREQKPRNLIEKNGVAKQGQTADKEKKQKNDDFGATAGVVPHQLFRQKPILSLQVSAWGFALL